MLSGQDRFKRQMKIAEARYGSVFDHVDRVGRYCELIAQQLGFSTARARRLNAAGRLHDFGKLAIPDEILLKTTALTDAERTIIESHTVIGYRLLSNSGSSFLDLAAMVALRHHERWDGDGYPGGLRERAIPIEGRIAAVADVFDSLIRDRPYRSALPCRKALEIIKAGRGTHFDPDVVDAFFARYLAIRRSSRLVVPGWRSPLLERPEGRGASTSAAEETPLNGNRD